MSLFHPTYFASVYQFAHMLSVDDLSFEVYDNFQKQTYRNRCYVYGSNGKQLLSVPIIKVSGKQLTKDVKIDYSSNWQAEHLKTLLSAYRSSPFFEFYIDDLQSIFTKKETFLVDLNLATFNKLLELFQESQKFTLTSQFNKEINEDYRYLINAKKNQIKLPKYTQVFDNKHGFISNLSVLDVLFMEGPAANLYLKKIAAISVLN